jgi:hypothetical protein
MNTKPLPYVVSVRRRLWPRNVTYLKSMIQKLDDIIDIVKRRVIHGLEKWHNYIGNIWIKIVLEGIKDGDAVIIWIAPLRLL